jgi:hypothetical protein
VLSLKSVSPPACDPCDEFVGEGDQRVTSPSTILGIGFFDGGAEEGWLSATLAITIFDTSLAR